MKIFRSILQLAFASLVTSPLLVFATDTPCKTGTICNPIKADNINDLLSLLFSVVMQVGVPIAVLCLIYTGFMFVMARGNPEKLTKARQAFMWTVIGTVILLGASVIARVLQATIGQVTP